MTFRGLCVLIAAATCLAQTAGAAAGAAATPEPTAPEPAAAEPTAPEPAGFWTGPINSPVPRTIAGGKVIHAAALARLLKAGNGAPAVVIDVSNAPLRPENMAPSAPWLPLPHHAIPGAVWIPGAGLGEPPAPVDAFFRDRLAQLTMQNKDRTVVVYCHERCWLSWNGAKRAIGYGYTHVYWFPEGIEGWRATGHETSTVEPETAP